MAITDQTVHLIKKFRKQNSLVSLSYPWIGPKFLTLDQLLRSYSQKTDFQYITLKTFPQKIFETAAAKLLDYFWFFSLQPQTLYPKGEWVKILPSYPYSGPFWGMGADSALQWAAGISPGAGIHRVKWLLEAETHIPPMVVTLWARMPLLEPLFVL